MGEANQQKADCPCGQDSKEVPEHDAPGGESACQLHQFPEWNEDLTEEVPAKEPIKKPASDPAQ